MNRLARAVAAAFAAVLLTSGCSMIPGLGGQSGVQACSTVSSALQDATTKLTTAMTESMSDPQAASKAAQEFVDALGQARSKVSNADVGAALDKAIAGGKKLVELLSKGDASAAASDDFTKATTDIQDGLSDFMKACTKI